MRDARRHAALTEHSDGRSIRTPSNIHRSPLRNQRGSALPIIGVTLMLTIGFTGLATDVSRISITATEVQTAADISASAGAVALLSGANPRAQAVSVLAANQINGSAIPSAALEELTVGNYRIEDDGTSTFVPSGWPSNAVRATVSATVRNLLIPAYLRQSPGVTTVRRTATASFRGMGSGRAALPLVLGECHFRGDCTEQSCMPALDQAPDNDEHSAWTGFHIGANQSDVLTFLPAACGGSGHANVEVRVGDILDLGNGQMSPVLKAVECMVDRLNMRRFVIPIVPCSPTFGSHPEPVLGFATVDIQKVVTNGPTAGIYLRGIFVATSPSSGGGGNYGTGAIALVE